MTDLKIEKQQLEDDWVVGFVDGDGSFYISRNKESTAKTPKRHRFIVSQDKRSKHVLYALREKFQCGTVQKQGRNMMCYQVGDKKSLLNVIIPFFLKHPLQTQKRKDFDRFRESVTTREIDRKDTSLTAKNKNDSCSPCACTYVRTSPSVSASPCTHQRCHVQKPLVNVIRCKENKGSNFDQDFRFSISGGWFAGFLDADGSFALSIVDNYPRPQLIIGATERDVETLKAVQRFLGSGVLRKRKDGFVIFQIASCVQLEKNVFPHLFLQDVNKQNNRLNTVKRVAAHYFAIVVKMILRKEHKTVSGMEKIWCIKKTFNKYE